MSGSLKSRTVTVICETRQFYAVEVEFDEHGKPVYPLDTPDWYEHIGPRNNIGGEGPVWHIPEDPDGVVDDWVRYKADEIEQNFDRPSLGQWVMRRINGEPIYGDSPDEVLKQFLLQHPKPVKA